MAKIPVLFLLVSTCLYSQSQGNEHCPSNCDQDVKKICDKVVDILDEVPLVPDFVSSVVGDAICFPDDVEPNSDTLCPKGCADSFFTDFGDDDDKDLFKKACYYVDSILQDIPTVPVSIRNITDRAICAIGSMIPDSGTIASNVRNEFLPAVNALEQVSHDRHCPSDCDPKFLDSCDRLLSLLEEVNVGGKVVIPDFVLDIVGKAMCFPKHMKEPKQDSLCPNECGKSTNSKFTQLCVYVDSILQTIPAVSLETRYITDHAICAFGDIFQEQSTTVSLDLIASTSEEPNMHCPDNCEEDLMKICNSIENLLLGFQFIPPLALDLVGKSICFPSQDGEPNGNSLCPTDCGQGDDDHKILYRVCNYVDNIMQSIPSLPERIRGMTDESICKLSNTENMASLEPLLGRYKRTPHSSVFTPVPGRKPPGKHHHKKKKHHDVHCPANCDDALIEFCDNIEGTLENVNFLPKFVLDIVGKGICFPKKGLGPNSKSLCPRNCGQANDKEQTFLRLCYYVDNILQSTPLVLPSVRNLTDHAICALADIIPPPKPTSKVELRAVLQ